MTYLFINASLLHFRCDLNPGRVTSRNGLVPALIGRNLLERSTKLQTTPVEFLNVNKGLCNYSANN